MTFLIGASGLCLAPAYGDLVVVKDYGGRPTNVPSEAQLAEQGRAYAESVKGQSVVLHEPELRYPILSAMHVGVVENHATPKPIAHPFFIVDDSPESVRWLTANKLALQHLGATGIATNLESPAQLTQLRELLAPITVVAVPVDAIATPLSLSHYPVLVTAKEIVQ